MNLEFIKPQNLGSLLMKSSQSNFNLGSPNSYLVRSYQITTVLRMYNFDMYVPFVMIFKKIAGHLQKFTRSTEIVIFFC